AQARRADHHHGVGEAGGRLGRSQERLCRPRSRAGDVTEIRCSRRNDVRRHQAADATMEERMKTIIRLAAAAAGLTIALGSVAWAQDAKPVRVRGTIEKVDGNTITAKLRDGSAATIKL